MSLEITRDAGVETWTLGFPPVNALDPELLSALEGAIAALDDSEDTSVVVLTSALRVFSAGADAKWMATVVDSEGADALLARFKAAMDRFREICLRMRRSPVLFIAAVGGHALAGGLELAAACDLRFAADEPRIQIGASEMKLFGVLPSGGGGTQFITRLMGPSRALEFILRAEPCGPQDALRLGLVDRLFEPAALAGETHAFATAIAGKAGRIGINAAKRAILDGASLPLYEAIELDRSVHWDSMRRGGFLPGVTDFVARFGRRDGGR
jgi:enoyl-CoA hydratase/carnithine racemase